MTHTGESLIAELRVAEAIETVLRGFRFSEDSATAEVAIRRERELEPEMHQLRELVERQSGFTLVSPSAWCVTRMGESLEAELRVAEAIEAVLRGFRISENSAIAEVAIRRERELEPQLRNLRATIRRQPEQLNLVPHAA